MNKPQTGATFDAVTLDEASLGENLPSKETQDQIAAVLARAVDAKDRRAIREATARASNRRVSHEETDRLQMRRAGARLPEAAIEQRGSEWVSFNPSTGFVYGRARRRRTLVRKLALYGSPS